MTHSQRNAKIIKKLSEYTAKNTKTKRAANAALVREGFYMKNGEVTPEFCTTSKKVKADA